MKSYKKYIFRKSKNTKSRKVKKVKKIKNIKKQTKKYGGGIFSNSDKKIVILLIVPILEQILLKIN
jgi:hypothetical protein